MHNLNAISMLCVPRLLNKMVFTTLCEKGNSSLEPSKQVISVLYFVVSNPAPNQNSVLKMCQRRDVIFQDTLEFSCVMFK